MGLLHLRALSYTKIYVRLLLVTFDEFASD